MGRMERVNKKFEVMARFALSIADLSTCKRLKVGAIIVDFDFSYVLALGYNGVPKGVDNNSCTGEAGTCGCVHAETNAILKLRVFTPSIMITTHTPCASCAGIIRNSPIIEVFSWTEYRVACSMPFTLIGKHEQKLRELYDSI